MKHISNMSNRKFKVMIMKILTGLEKRMEDFNETLNKEKANIKKLITDKGLNN